MFLLNNISNREYDNFYKTELGQSKVLFDLSLRQIRNATNEDWNIFDVGDLCCVITSDKKFSNIFVVREKGNSGIGDDYVIRGDLVAKVPDDPEFTSLFNYYDVNHKRLPMNMLSTGFNVANLGDKLKNLRVNINRKIHELTLETRKSLLVGELAEYF